MKKKRIFSFKNPFIGYSKPNGIFILKDLDEYFSKIVDCHDLDTTDVEIFVDGLMKKFGSSRIKNQEEKLPILKQNIPEKLSGEIDIQSLVGKVIEGKVDDWRKKAIKMRKVEL